MAQAVNYSATLDKLISMLPANLQKPRVGIVCGSGLSGLVEILREVVTIPYANIPGFGESTGKMFLFGVRHLDLS